MKENIKVITQNFCEELLTFTSRPDMRIRYNSDLFDISMFEYVKFSTNYFIDSEINFGVSPKDDCESSIQIFKQMMNLDRVQANDKRLWTCLTHTRFFDYTRKRWSINSQSSDDTIISRFHFEGTGVEARMRNAISRLWWTAKITYDAKREDPFELTRLIWEKQDIHVALMERSFGTYPNFVHNFLDFYKVNKQLSEDNLRLILRGINSIGGVKMLPLLQDEEIMYEIKRVATYGSIKVS